MKKSYLLALLVIAVAISIIVSSAGDASQYVSFAEAKALLESGDEQKVHVVGELTKNETGEIVGVEYDPVKDPNYIAFTLKDDKQVVQKVICYNPPPSIQELKKSEKVVIIGKYTPEGVFVAKEILMKCPSKYEEKEIKGAS